jgi:hypothetical protein
MGKPTRQKTLRQPAVAPVPAPAGEPEAAGPAGSAAPESPATAPVREAAASALPFGVPTLVELVEGQTYTVRGTTFRRNRPRLVSDPRVLERVTRCSRFRSGGA